MSHAGHEIVKCSCGTVIRQCRCIGPKVTRVIPHGCTACQVRIATQAHPVYPYQNHAVTSGSVSYPPTYTITRPVESLRAEDV